MKCVYVVRTNVPLNEFNDFKIFNLVVIVHLASDTLIHRAHVCATHMRRNSGSGGRGRGRLGKQWKFHFANNIVILNNHLWWEFLRFGFCILIVCMRARWMFIFGGNLSSILMSMIILTCVGNDEQRVWLIFRNKSRIEVCSRNPRFGCVCLRQIFDKTNNFSPANVH